MPVKPSPYLLSDARSLRRIKLSQFRRQIPALILLLLALALNYIFPSRDLYTPALILAVAAIAWFVFIGLCHRYKRRIHLPPPNSLVSPLQGKIRYIHGNEDITLVNIRKVLLDSVEIRSPHSACSLQEGALHLAVPQGKISFRFSFAGISWFEVPDMRSGNIIGMAYGAGTCTITLPRNLEFKLQAGANIDAGDVLIEDLASAAKTLEPQPKLVVESFADFSPETPAI